MLTRGGGRIRGFRAALGLFPLLALPAVPARALDIDPASVLIERQIPGNTWWTPSGTTVFKNDLIRVTVTLINDQGTLGPMFAGDTTPCAGCGAAFNGFLCPTKPGNTSGIRADPTDGTASSDPGLNLYPGKYWIMPVVIS